MQKTVKIIFSRKSSHAHIILKSRAYTKNGLLIHSVSNPHRESSELSRKFQLKRRDFSTKNLKKYLIFKRKKRLQAFNQELWTV